MLKASQALDKLAAPHDARFSDAFLIVCPWITIRDRLRVPVRPFARASSFCCDSW